MKQTSSKTTRRGKLGQWLQDITAIVLIPGAAVLLLGMAVVEQLSWRDLEKTTGVITENVVGRPSEGGQFCTIAYSFTDGEGREYRGRDRTGDRACPKNPAGGPIAIEYVRGDPGHSRIAGGSDTGITGTFGALFFLSFLFVWLGPARRNRSADERVRSAD